MPSLQVGSSTSPGASERTSVDHTSNTSEQAGSRSKVPLGRSCAECRRSKLKCNRVFPCEACIRRQCAHLCPNGTLNATKGNAVLLTRNTQLQSQLSDALASKRQLEARVRELEMHASTAPRQQPRGTIVPGRSSGPASSESTGLRDLNQAVGSLSIGAEGQTKYYGETASSDHLGALLPSNIAPLSTPDNHIFARLEHASILVHLTGHFPLGMAECPYNKDEIFMPLIPSWEEAQRYKDLYYEHSAWMYDPLPKKYFDQLLASIYPFDQKSLDNVSSHALASFFMIMALGAYYLNQQDTEKPHLFHQLSRAAFCMDSIYDKSSCSTVEALMLMITFMLNFESAGFEARWILMGICVRVAQSIGLHTDGAHWNLAADEQNRRRNLFWEVFTYDAWMGLVTGRPPALSAVQTNVRFPEDEQPHLNNEGQPDGDSWHAWKFRYSAECLAPVIQHIFSSRIGYDSLLDLDKRIREHPVPEHLRAPGPEEDSTITWSKYEYHAMTQYCLLCEKESNLLYIHRAYFVHVLREKPQDPLKHRFGRSVDAVYQSAHRLITSLKDVYEVCPRIVKRSWFFWSGIYSSCVVLAALVIESPGCSLAKSALDTLMNSIEFYDVGSKDCRPEETLDKLRKLAHRANRVFGSQQYETVDDGETSENDELSVLKGQKNVIINQTPSNSPSPRINPHLRPSSSSPRPNGSQTGRLLQAQSKRLSLPPAGDFFSTSSGRSPELMPSAASNHSPSGHRGTLTSDSLHQSMSMGYPTSNLRGTDDMPSSDLSSSLSTSSTLPPMDTGMLHSSFSPPHTNESMYLGSTGSTNHRGSNGSLSHEVYQDQEMDVSGPAAEESSRGGQFDPQIAQMPMATDWPTVRPHQARSTMQSYDGTQMDSGLSSTMHPHNPSHLQMSQSSYYSAPNSYPYATFQQPGSGSHPHDQQLDGSHLLYGVVDGDDFINPQTSWLAYTTQLYDGMQRQTPQQGMQDLPQHNYQPQMYHHGGITQL